MGTQQPAPANSVSKGFFEKFSSAVTKATGSSAAFIIAFLTVIVWAITGPFFHYSENWQLVINTGTTIVTFLMVFLIQKAQNKESMSVQLKLNELIAATKGASNRLVSVENLTEEELQVLQKHYETMAEITKQASDLRQSHSVEEAIKDTAEKLEEDSETGHML
ncbi:low affinity iron permease family protein [Spirosoma sp. KCTC 42546]|uniref:low affinity iron permease family protein n=1 Tax=Spirosoma sp. KCTC 42546 TaxID=2520506 RepID=UPI0011579C30|nr:low affinity iron permease family protein [Spirosoma sp. KCTC 42546]QDK82987.1 low affinity iron permease family protein [Spirosoma sp. KCTC 42546]